MKSLSQHLGELKLSGTNCDFVNDGVGAVKVGSNYLHLGSSNELRYGTSAPTTAASGTEIVVTNSGIADDSITIAKLDESVLQSVSTTMDATTVNALETTGVDLVAAQGASKIILPIGVLAEYTYDTTAFTIGGSDVFAVGFSGGATFCSIAGTGFVDQTSSSKRYINATASAVTALANTKVRVYNTGTGFSDGGSSTVKLTLLYRVITIS